MDVRRGCTDHSYGKVCAMDNSLTREMEIAAELAQVGGRSTLKYFQAGVSVEIKEDATPVTVADRQAEQIIRDGLKKAFPDDGIFGEEFGNEVGLSGRRWIIDPIDGTKSFVRGVPLYGVLVGMENEHGDVVVGAAYLPALDEMVHAAIGHGCWWNGRRACVSDVSDLTSACVCYTSTRNFGVCGHDRLLEDLGSKVGLLRGWGDCYGHLLVATGRAEIMLDPILSPWDCAALVPILSEAGGSFTDWRGTVTIDGKNGLSTNGLLLNDVLSWLSPGEVRQ